MSQQVTRQARHRYGAGVPAALIASCIAWSCSSSEEPATTGGAAGQGGSGAAGSTVSTGGAAGVAGGTADDAAAGGPSTPEADAEFRGDEPALPCGRSSELCCPPDKTCGDGLTCSDQFCLTCGPPPAPREGCTNVATGAVATAQQTFPANPLAALNDNDVCSAWGSGDYPDIAGAAEPGTWLQLDLGDVKTLDAMTFWVKQTPASAEVTLAFAYSIDGEAWTAWPSDLGVTKRINDSAPWLEDFVPAITARYFKVTFVKSASFVSMRELALYACPAL